MFPCLCLQKPVVKSGIVCHEDTVADKRQKLWKYVLDRRSVRYHPIRDRRQFCNALWDVDARVDKRTKPIRYAAAADPYGADLDDPVVDRRKTCRLEIEHDKITRQLLAFFIFYREIVQIINQISLTAVKDLKVIVLGKFQSLERMVGIWKRLHNAVIRNRHRTVPPCTCPIDKLFDICNAVHIAHLRVCVQFHPLYWGAITPPHTEILDLFYPCNAADTDIFVITIIDSRPFDTHKISFFNKFEKIGIRDLLIFNK